MIKPEVCLGLLAAVAVIVLVCFFVMLTLPAAPLTEYPLPSQQVGQRLDINTANIQQLSQLPGVNSAQAEAIVAHRDANGPFENIGALLDVKGIGNQTLEQIIPYITVGG